MLVNRRHAHRHSDSQSLLLNLHGWRVKFLSFLLLLSFAALLLRGIYLLIVSGDFLQEKGSSRYLREMNIVAMRGKITDRNGKLLAVSTPMRAIWAIPQDARGMNAHQKSLLAHLLKMSEADLTQKLASDKNFVYLNRRVSPESALKIAQLQIAGIHEEKTYKRFYPLSALTAHVVGFTGIQDNGLEGAELAFERELLGIDGKRVVLRDRRGHIIEDVKAIQAPLNGKDITLSIDAHLQYVAFTHLKETVLKHRAKAGSVVVINPHNGDILAMANYPSYNPNSLNKNAQNAWRNRAVTDTFEPGSALKPFTVALALEKGTHRYESVVDTSSTGHFTIGANSISDIRAYGNLTVAQVIQKSSNIGAAKIGLAQKPEDLWQTLNDLGFGQSPNVGFPGEGKGRLRNWKHWREVEQATMSYGHGISVSLLQLARAYSVFARSGDLVSLSFKKSNVMKTAGVEIFSDQTVREMRAILELTTQDGGTGVRARIPGYRVGVKTGTANKIESGNYVKKYVSDCVGIAPLSNPQLVVAVAIDEPSENGFYGGVVAAPLFAKVMGNALHYLGIPEDATEEKA